MLRPKGLRGFSHEPHAIGKFHGILGELFQLDLRCVPGQQQVGCAERPIEKNDRRGKVMLLVCLL